jgi:hypothetical protein
MMMETQNELGRTPESKEHQLRVDLMTIQIERLRQEMKMENRKFVVQLVLALAAAVGVGVAIGRFWLFHA